MIKIILFDFGNVLGSETNVLAIDKKIAEKTGLSNDSLLSIFDAYWPQLKVGEIDLNDYHKAIVEKSTKFITVEELRKLHYEKISTNPAVFTLAKDLKNKGYRIMILSNESKQGMEDKKKKFQLIDLFEKVYNSAEISMAKPDSKIFEYVIKDLGVTPDSILFIDDWDMNVAAAKIAGMQAIQFHTVEELKKELLL